MEIDVRWDRLDRLLLLFHQFLIKMTGVAFLCLLPQIPEIPVIHFRQRFHNDLPGKIGFHERKISEALRFMLVLCPCDEGVFVGLCQIFHDQLELLIFRSRELFRDFFDVRKKPGVAYTQWEGTIFRSFRAVFRFLCFKFPQDFLRATLHGFDR